VRQVPSDPPGVCLCREHGVALCEAARGCGARTDEEVLDFIEDMITGGDLYAPLYAFVGEEAGALCLLCAYAFPNEAINNAVAAALTVRKQYGLRPRLN